MSAFSYTKFVLAFLPKSKCLLISWQQSLSAGILEPKKIKYATIFTFSPFKGTCAVLRLVTQFCQTLCDPIDSSRLGFLVRGVLQARILEWVAISFSRGSDLPTAVIELGSSALQAILYRLSHQQSLNDKTLYKPNYILGFKIFLIKTNLPVI